MAELPRPARKSPYHTKQLHIHDFRFSRGIVYDVSPRSATAANIAFSVAPTLG
jgi:hypothetical protein